MKSPREDLELVCSPGALRERGVRGLVAFFAVYSRAKAVSSRARGKRGRTVFVGIETR